MAEFDRALLAATGRDRPRVVILPTASSPDGEDVFQRWAAMGVAHFASLGAEVEPVLVRTGGDADGPGRVQAIGEADLVYLSGGKPGYLLEVLARLAGRAGARATAQRARGGRRRLLGRGDGAGRTQLLGSELRLAAVAGPLATRARRSCRARGPAALRRLAGAAVGADRAAGAARVGRAGHRRGHGVVGPTARGRSTARARVTVWRGRRRERFRAGEAFRL